MAANHAPQQASGFVAVDLSEGLPRRVVQQIDETAVIVLAEVMQSAPDQPVSRQFAPKRPQFTPTFAQNRVGYTARTAETSHDSADRGYLHLGGCIANQIDLTVAYGAPNADPAAVNGDARTLVLERLESFFFQKTVEVFFRVAALFSNDAECATVLRFGDQPVEIGGVVGDEPDLSRVGRIVFWSFTSAWTKDTVSTGGQPEARATRLATPSAPTTLFA